MAGDVIVVKQAEAVGERWFQSRVSPGDIQWVAVVINVQQFCDTRLRGVASVVDAQVAHVREAVTKVQGGGHVGHGTNRVSIHSLITLDEFRLLRLYHQSHVEVVLGTNHPKSHVHLVRIVLVLRKTTQVFIQIRFVGMFQSTQITVPVAVHRTEAGEEVLAQVAEVVGRAVALAVAVVELVTQLQKRGLPQGFAIRGLHAVVPVLRRC